MIGNVLQLADEIKPQLIRGTILHIISAIFAASLYVFLYLILNQIIDDSLNINTALTLGGAIAGCLLLQGLFLYWANSFTYINSYRMTGKLRLRVGEHLRQLPMGFFSQMPSGELNGIVTDDMRKIEPFLSYIYPKIVSGFATPVFMALCLAFIDWRLTLAILAVCPIALVIYFGNQKLIQKLTELQKRATVTANSRMIEYIQGIPILRAFNQTGSRFIKLEQALDNYKQTNLNLVTQLVTPAIAFCSLLDLGLVVVLGVGSYLLFQGELTTPILLLFLVLGLHFYTPLSGLFDFAATTRMMDAALQRVTQVLDTPPMAQSTQGRKLNSFDIEWQNVSFSYENTPVLQSVSFQVPERTVTALVGPSGAGKTTITNLITRFWDVDDGRILVGGIDIKDLPIDELLSNISVVFQDVYLFNDTILNNIKFGKPNATLDEVIFAASLAQCHEFIVQLPQGYDTLIGEGGATLSGGEKQRIAIARAILKDAPIVLLDEATASVDPENEILIQKAIDSLVQSKTLIIIAHRLSTITSAHQILVIDDGKIVEQGQHSQLLAMNGLYRRLWDSRQQAQTWKLGV